MTTTFDLKKNQIKLLKTHDYPVSETLKTHNYPVSEA